MAQELLQFDNLEQYLLLKNGNYLYKVPFRDGFAVLKVYYGSRSLFRYVTGTISNFFEGQTSFMPRARLANEKKCLKIWHDAGFRVFKTYDNVKVKDLPEGGYMLLEYLPALKFEDYYGDDSVPIEERLNTYRRFLKEWHKRHEIAVKEREPRLIHENGDMKHVMIIGDEFLYFDFEMTFRSRSKVEEFVSREILAYLKSLGKIVGPELFELFLQETINNYPNTEYLHETYRFMFKHPNIFHRLGRMIDRKIHPRASKPFSKYNVALKLKKKLSS